MVKKLAFAITAAGWLCLTAISPIPAEAAVLQVSPSLAPTVESDIMQVRCYSRYNQEGKLKRFCDPYGPDYGPYDQRFCVPYLQPCNVLNPFMFHPYIHYWYYPY